MSDVSIFKFEESFTVRTVIKDNEPWFVAKDVCDVLGLTNSRVAVSPLDEDEKGVSKVYTPSGEQEMCVINESGLYALVIRSNKPNARKFRKWITAEVLPAIRRTGRYAAPVQPELPLPDRAALPERSRSGIAPRMEYNGVAVMPIWEIARATGRTLGGLNTRKHDCNYDLIEGTDVFRGVIITPELRKNAERAGYQLCARASIANFYTATGVDKLLVVKGAPAAVRPEVLPPVKGELPKPALNLPRRASGMIRQEYGYRLDDAFFEDDTVERALRELYKAGYDVGPALAKAEFMRATLRRVRSVHQIFGDVLKIESSHSITTAGTCSGWVGRPPAR